MGTKLCVPDVDELRKEVMKKKAHFLPIKKTYSIDRIGNGTNNFRESSHHLTKVEDCL